MKTFITTFVWPFIALPVGWLSAAVIIPSAACADTYDEWAKTALTRSTVYDDWAREAMQFDIRPAPDTNDYAAMRAEAIRTGKPLVVWIGGDFCPLCVKDTAKEFLHCFVDRFPGASKAPAIVVSTPEDGDLAWAGEVTWWITGDSVWGHSASVRRVLDAYRRLGSIFNQNAPPQTAPVQRQSWQPFSQAPVRMGRRGGSC